MKRKIACLLLGLSVGGHACAFELSITGISGIDSNPLSLPDQHDPDLDVFLFGNINFSANYFNNFYVKAYARQKLFVDDDRADRFKSKLDLAYKSKFKYKSRDVRYALSTDLTKRDKTYVSKTTGEVATFGGQSIKDRYDYSNHNYKASISYRNEARLKVKLKYQMRDKNYDNFSIPGLSDFDYEHDRYSLSLDYPASDKSRLIFEIGTTKRDFKDKRADDLAGDDIPNTDLKYDYNFYELDYYYKDSKKWRFKAAFDYVVRKDNAVGYSDSTLSSLGLSGKYSHDNKTIEASIVYAEYSYDNRSVVDELSLEEEDNDRKGFNVKLEYLELISSAENRELSLYILVQIDDIDSTDPIFEYQRNSIAAGIRYELF